VTSNTKSSYSSSGHTAVPLELRNSEVQSVPIPAFSDILSACTTHKVKVKVTLRLTVCQSVCLGVEPHLELMTRYLAIAVWLLRSFFCGAPSLTRGRVCLLYMLLSLPKAVFLGSESFDTRDHILLSQIWDFPFRRLLRLAGSRWRYSTPPTHGFVRSTVKVKVTLRLTISQSVSLGVEPHLGLMTRYLLLFDSYGLVFFCGAPSLTRGRVCLLSESLRALVSHLL
jgi:hypothetical protein